MTKNQLCHNLNVMLLLKIYDNCTKLKIMMKKYLLTTMVLLAGLMNAQVSLIIEQPSNLAGPLNFTYADNWGANWLTTTITSEVVFGKDATAGDSLGCFLYVNDAEVNGKIAIVYRGDCEFSAKALRAQDAGAIALIVINNIPGNPIAMGGGAAAAQITIPVAMISQEDGAALRNIILGGQLVVFLGNKTGLFANDLSISKADVVTANSFTTPISLIQNQGEFQIPLGSWVFNRGNQAQDNVRLSAEIKKGNDVLYNNISDNGISIAPGDSLYVTLPVYNPSTIEQGFYTITYVASAESADDFAGDNQVIRNFHISTNTYSKNRIDENGVPLETSGLRPADGAEYTWCISLQSSSANGLKARGMTFSTVTTTDVSLIGKTVRLQLIKWDDDISSAFTFNVLEDLTEAFYDYSEDSQGEFVTVDFDSEIALENDQKYLACASVFDEDVFISIDNELDYRGNDGFYTLPPFPLRSSAWFAGGFGLENVPALILNISNATSIADVNNAKKINIYPNPSQGLINIPLKGFATGQVAVEVFNTQGQLVMREQAQMNNQTLQFDASHLSNGLYQFALTFSDGSRSALPVLISK